MGGNSWANMVRRARLVSARRDGPRAPRAYRASVRYEGYGPGGAAVLIDAVTEDRSRFEGALRRLLAQHGGHLGAAGSVSYLFNPVGRLCYPPGTPLQPLTQLALEAGAEDIVANADGSVEVLTDPPDFASVLEQLTRRALAPAMAELTWRAASALELSGSQAVRMLRLLEALEGLGEVIDVYSDVEFPAEELNA